MALELTDELRQPTIFDHHSDQSMYIYHESLGKLEEQFVTLGLSGNQFKVFLYIGKYGSKTAIEICRALRMHRTEVYSLLKRLMNLGMGVDQIHSKMKQMISQSKVEFLIAGSEKNYLQFYHADIFSSLGECKAEQRFVTTSDERSFYVFETINGSKVRKIPLGMVNSFPSFAIRDGEEMLLLLGKADAKSRKAQTAIWTDSIEMINSLQLLFRLVWSQSMETSLTKVCLR